ncbi:MAG: DNA polymerase III subunit delta [Candidatus Aureabacteria bacterium]|nr:DNA polymerase III subunit delta [Candidatus Auribacterota bacterium]
MSSTQRFTKRRAGAPSPGEAARDILASARAGRIFPVYLLHGEESYMVEDTAKKLIDILLPGEGRDFSLDTLSGPAVAPGEIGSALGTLPLFGGGRVVWLRGCALFKSAERADAALKNLPANDQGTVAVITEEDVDRRLALYRAIEGRGAAAYFPRFSETHEGDLKALGSLIASRVKEEGVRISPVDVFYLVQLVGTDLRALFSELEKLSLHRGRGGTISREDIDLLVAPRGEAEAYQLADTIAGGDLGKSFDVLRRVLTQGASPVYILDTLVRRVRFLLQAAELTRAGTLRWTPSFNAFKPLLERVPAPLRGMLGKDKRHNIFAQNPYAVYKIAEVARGLAPGRLRAALARLVRADSDVKGRGVAALEDLLVALGDLRA